MNEAKVLREAAERVVATVPVWPIGEPDDGTFIVRAKIWGDALNVAAALLRTKDDDRLAIAVIRHAERQAIKSQMTVWAYVADFLGVGSTRASEFCGAHLPSIGWKKVEIHPPPEDTVVYGCEGLGDTPVKMASVGGQWFRAKNKKARAKVFYAPTWWKECR